MATRPVIDLSIGLFLGEPVTLLDLAGEFHAPPLDDIKVVVRELAPSGLNLALVFGPFAFDDIPVHGLSFHRLKAMRRERPHGQVRF